MKDTWTIITILLLVAASIVAIWFYATRDGANWPKSEEENSALNNNQENNMENNTNYSGAILKTNMGDIEISFFKEEAPNTVANFVQLSEKGFYNGTKFHRVIKGFMIQGGDPLTKEADKSKYGFGGPGYTFEDEISEIQLKRGVVAMANSGPDTNGSQFFIITAPETAWLQGMHTPFAEVVSGMENVDQIENVEVGERDIPVEDVIVEEIVLK